MTPADIAPLLSSALKGLSNAPAEPLTIRPVGGGSINDSFEVLTKDAGRWFCKVSDSVKYLGLFAAEARGLELLAGPGIFRVPLTIACIVLDERQVLLLEWLLQGARDTRFWRLYLPRAHAKQNTRPGQTAYD